MIMIVYCSYHPEEGSGSKVCILFDGGQDTEDQTHQDHEEAKCKANVTVRLTLLPDNCTIDCTNTQNPHYLH